MEEAKKSKGSNLIVYKKKGRKKKEHLSPVGELSGCVYIQRPQDERRHEGLSFTYRGGELEAAHTDGL